MVGIPPRFRALTALVAGAVTPLAFAPFNLWFLIFVTPAVLYSLIRHAPVKTSAWYGWLFGFGFYGTGVSWVYRSIHDFGGTPLPLAVLLTVLFAAGLALFFTFQTYLYARWFSRKGFSVAGFAATWMFAEWLRSWFLTGFPWLYSGYALIDTPFSALAPMGGVWLVSLVAVTISVCIANLFTAKTLPQRAMCAATITVLCLLPLLDKEWTQPKGEPFDLDIVQANIPQDLKWNPNYLPDFLMRYINITQEQTRAPVVVWPETAVAANYSEASPYLLPLLQQFDQDQRILISGIPSIEYNPRSPEGYDVFNSLAVLTGNGDVYHKQRLVPFGEYVPFQTLLRKIGGFFDLPMSSFSLPAPGQGPLQAGTMKVSAAICYEIAYPELVRETAQESDWLITVSNDTWFSNTIAPDQHLQIARMRALENGRWLVRSTNNGLTALIAPDGKISISIPPYKEGILHGTLQNRIGHTPYQRWGLWPVAIISLVLLGLALRLQKRES